MKLLGYTDALLSDIGIVQKKAYRLKERGRQFHDAVKCVIDLLYEISKIIEEEGIKVDEYEDLPAKLRELIAKLKEPHDATS